MLRGLLSCIFLSFIINLGCAADEVWRLASDRNGLGPEIESRVSGDDRLPNAVLTIEFRLVVPQNWGCRVLLPYQSSDTIETAGSTGQNEPTSQIGPIILDVGLVRENGRTVVPVKRQELKSHKKQSPSLKDMYSGTVKVIVGRNSPPGLYTVRFPYSIIPPLPFPQSKVLDQYFHVRIPIGPFTDNLRLELQNNRRSLDAVSVSPNRSPIPLRFGADISRLRFKVKNIASTSADAIFEDVKIDGLDNLIIGGPNRGSFTAQARCSQAVFWSPILPTAASINISGEVDLVSDDNPTETLWTEKFDKKVEMFVKVKPDNFYFFIAPLVCAGSAVICSLLKNYKKLPIALNRKSTDAEKVTIEWTSEDTRDIVVLPFIFGTIAWVLAHITDARLSLGPVVVTSATYWGAIGWGALTGFSRPEDLLTWLMGHFSVSKGSKP